jgi:thymidylate synthase
VSSTAFGSGQYTARYLNIVLGDAHLYSNHLAQAETMLSRKAVEYNWFNGPPRLEEPWLHAGQAINRFMDDPAHYSVINYRHNGVLKGDVAV